MNECHCVIKHTNDPKHRAQALTMLESSNKTEWLMALAMLSPCPSRKEAS